MRAALLAMLLAGCVAAMPLAGCVAVTINVSFPQEKIEGAAENIEDLVRTPKEPPPDPKIKSGAPNTRGTAAGAPDTRGGAPRPSTWLGWLRPRVVEAQQPPELKTRTPEVLAVIESRRARFPELDAAQTRGCIGETNQGLVESRPGQGCPANVGALVAAENRDRMALYRTLVEQNSMPPGDIARVQSAFGKINREKAGPGTWIQQESGEWTRK
jgi:uncharacterized protein YdbL (DUF1318 family)